MKDRVLITGASGFIGYHLVQAAQKAGLEVHAAVRRTSDLTQLNELSPVLVYPDFSSKETLKRTLEEGNYRYIIHAAGATRAKNLKAYNLINADYTLNLAQAASATSTPVKRFIFMSSLAAVGPLSYQEEQPITETTLPIPVTSYGKSKLLAEHYLGELKEKGLPITIIRPTAVYGPREKDLFILFKTLQKGLDLYIGKKPQRLSFVYVKDLVSATMAALFQKQNQNRVYNISDGGAYSRYTLANLFRNLSGKHPFRFHLPVSMMEVVAGLLDVGYTFSGTAPVLNREKIRELTAPNWVCSIEAARAELNYQPQYDLSKGLAETLQWYRENKWL
ncbi:NAD(P)-dependent oxidoreductase [Larkinella knui]|uniref:NAD-dependent epimerase/dehydratase family protein n=1 Tax=Larkinella knui TaxID=2025310 RepID=A0A3P1CWV5_9BACT|nr:NAD-dependent epimerase/dehydratase family protein [Larkinella knui]RRB17897.1 NAD-dependent epimerase/dehydratase family protein [Larkinella knui]